MPRVVASPAAFSDLTDICLYIAADSPASADFLLDRIERACRVLAEHPFLGRPREELAPNVHGFPIGNYVVFEEPVRVMVTGCTAFSRPRARMALRRDAGCIASNGRRRPGASKTRPFRVDPGCAIAASRRLDDAPASPTPPLLALAHPGSMQPMTITRTGS